MAALLIGMISFYAAYLVAAAVALAILYYSGALDPLMVMAAAIFVLVAIGIPALVLACGSGRLSAQAGLILGRASGFGEFRALRWCCRRSRRYRAAC